MYSRLDFMTKDQYGYDPLTDALASRIASIPFTGKHTITEAQEGRADLLSLLLLKSQDLWWFLLDYNNLASTMDLRMGVELLIPDLGILNAVIVEASTKKVANRTISIK